MKSDSTVLELRRKVNIRDHHLQEFQGQSTLLNYPNTCTALLCLLNKYWTAMFPFTFGVGHMEAAEQQFVALQMWMVQSDSALAELRREAEVRDHQLREYHGQSSFQFLNK